MRMFRIWVVVLLAMFAELQLCAQQNLSRYQVGIQAGVSHSGWNLGLVAGYRQDWLSFYAGPTISLTRGLPPKGPWGMNMGLNYHLPSAHNWLSSIVNLDYQFNHYHGADLMHEFHLSYGLAFALGDRFSIVQQLGYGFYLESVKNANLGKRESFSGYSGLLRVRANYHF